MFSFLVLLPRQTFYERLRYLFVLHLRRPWEMSLRILHLCLKVFTKATERKKKSKSIFGCFSTYLENWIPSDDTQCSNIYKLSILFEKLTAQAWGVFRIITRYYYTENVTELRFWETTQWSVFSNYSPIWKELGWGNTMGFGTEGSLVLKNENRKRISNKEFQVISDWFVTVLIAYNTL